MRDLRFFSCFTSFSVTSGPLGVVMKSFMQLNPVNSLSSTIEIAEFINSVGLDEVAYNEPPHLDIHCLPSSL